MASENPCQVTLPEYDPCCISPCDPPWLPDKQCFVWYEYKYLQVPIKGDQRTDVPVFAPARYYIEFRITYAHRLCLVGKQHGPLLFTLTLLPGEKVTLYHSERYRQITSVQDRYSVQTTFMQFLSVVHEARATDTLNTLSDKLSKVSGGGSVSFGGGLGSLFGAPSGSASVSTSTTDHNVVQTSHVASQFDQSVAQSSVLTHAERSTVVSLFAEKDSVDTAARTFQNDNACRAVTYMVRKIVELYTLSTEVVAIDYRIIAPNVPSDWHMLNDLGWLPPAIATQVKDAAQLLPKIGEVIVVPRPISIPTDGVVYDPELAHCNSCEPERAAAIAVSLEKQKAEALKTCAEARLLELELERRSKLLEAGTLTPFDGVSSSDAVPQPEA